MTYDEFICYVKDYVADILDDTDCIVKVHKVLKNNDIELDALTVVTKMSNVSPTIYLNSYYEEYNNGREAEQIVKEIYTLYSEYNKSIDFNVDVFKDYEQIKNRIAYKLVNTKANEKLLKIVPNVPFMDLSFVFYCLLDDDYLGSATALIHNDHLEMWGVSVKDLFAKAKENTPRLLEYELRDMNDVIKDMLVADLKQTVYENDDRYDRNCDLPHPEEVADGLMREIKETRNALSMYVLTNKQRSNGAVCMIYDKVLEEFAKQQGKDVYILPSSVHEVILVPAVDGIKRQELTDMVKEVNINELDDIDILSDHVYIYDIKDKTIKM